MAQQRYETYGPDGTCTRVWYVEVPDPPLAAADVALALTPADVSALNLALTSVATVPQMKVVFTDLVTRLST